MKKMLYCAAALASILFAASCQQEKFETMGDGMVTFTVTAPGGLDTRAIADGNNVDEVHYAVYKNVEGVANSLYTPTEKPLVQGWVPMSNKEATLELDLLQDQEYTILFWAQKSGMDHYELRDLRKVRINSGEYTDSEGKVYRTVNANDESRAAFFRRYDFNTTSKQNYEVELYRPFAQINLGTTNSSLSHNPQENQSQGYSITVNESEMIIAGVSSSFDLIEGEGSNEADQIVDYLYTSQPTPYKSGETLTVNDIDYHYVAMNYLLVPIYDRNVTVSYKINTDKGDIYNTITNIPVKENFRTNILGNLLTSKTDFEIVVDPVFSTNNNSGVVEVVGEGIVKNQNGDYEVSNAIGLAYAINNLFKNGGRFYIIKDIDMTGVKYDATDIPAGVTVELIGQVPVVTRSTTEPTRITGLGYGAIIDTNNGAASFFNLSVGGTPETTDTPAFINVNNGTVDITSCEADLQSFIGENNGSVNESNNTSDNPIIKDDNGETLTKVGTADQLVAALEAGKGVLFTNDIVINPANMSNAYGKTGINVKNGQTIDGGGYKLDIHGAGGTWDSGINTTGGLIKNITVTGSFRGIFVNHNSTYFEPVVLENVTLEGVTYTISCDQGKNQTLLATNSTFKGWTSYAATLGSAKFINCTFEEGNGYAYCRPYAPTEFVGCAFIGDYTLDPRAEITLNNCTLNGVALTSANLGDLVTDVEKADTPTSVGNADALVEALEAGEDVFFTSDIKIDPANMSNAYGATGINVKRGQAIDGGGHTLDIKGAGGTWDSGISTTGGLIKDLTVTGSFRGIFINHNSDQSEKVILENVTIDGTVYTISCDQGTNQGLEATNSTFNGWTSYAKTLGTAKFTNCSFGEGSGYAFCRPYAPTEFVGCAFEAGFEMDPVAAVTFENCTIGGVALTATNISTLVTSNITNVASVNGFVQGEDFWKNNGTYIVTSATGLTNALGSEDAKDIVLVPGTYEGTFTMKSDVTVEGPEGPEGAIVDCINLNGSDNVTLKNIKFDAAGAQKGYDGKGGAKQTANIISGLQDAKSNIDGAMNVTIEGCVFEGTYTDGGVAIAFTDQNRGSSGNINIQGCTFDTIGAFYHIYGHYFGGNGLLTIAGNTFKSSVHPQGYPVYLGRYQSSEPVIVTGNNFNTVDSLESAVYLQSHGENYNVSMKASNNKFATE